jgi:hypothetical protein
MNFSRFGYWNRNLKLYMIHLLQILIDSKQHYKFLGRNIDLISLIKLYIEDGKVVRHEDWYALQIPMQNYP